MSQPTTHSRRSLLKILGTTAVGAPLLGSDLFARSPAKPLRHASFGADGMAWADLSEIARCENVEIVAICDVDLNRTTEARANFPAARVYQDWRELLDKEAGNIDSVNVSTPDHMHAPIALACMEAGKHVYGQKPLAHDLYEVRRMTEMAREKKVVTQMGIQVHSASEYRTAAKAIQDGTIGKIKEVHSWSSKSWGDPSTLPETADPVPEGLDWDLWLGVCAERPFIKGYYHPGEWRKRLDFGTGTLGDMGCHILDPVFKGVGLKFPLSVRSEGPAPNATNWAVNGKVIYTYAATPACADKTMMLTWYDGNSSLPPEILAHLEETELPGQGSIFIGTEGTLLLPHVAQPVLFPKEKFKDHQIVKLPGESHWAQFTAACQGKGKTSADFDYAGPLTECILLGGVASRFPKTELAWNSADLEFDSEQANTFVRREYREPIHR